MKKIGLFFGTFNPLHIGHLIISEYIKENSDLNEIWFVVTPSNPLKNKKLLLNELQRLYMVNLALEDDLRFRSCDIEFKLPYPSYTVNTLAFLQEKYPQYQFALIMGEDNLENIEKWKNWEFILEHYQIYTYPRVGYNSEKFDKHHSIIKIDAPKIELSSTQIRDSIKNKKSVKYMLLPKIERYINEMGFYK
ncbi:MAG: nicotinate-nucleotide adenylyltransferase [Bacteroidales bacterium]|jgi:nicotinate-nucleotide adenylyltransferase|nr:nicotinate-nucleotide adenylyltransferase [Bacteroidales bacterium]